MSVTLPHWCRPPSLRRRSGGNGKTAGCPQRRVRDVGRHRTDHPPASGKFDTSLRRRRFRCCFLVSRLEYTPDGTDRRTDGRAPERRFRRRPPGGSSESEYDPFRRSQSPDDLRRFLVERCYWSNHSVSWPRPLQVRATSLPRSARSTFAGRLRHKQKEQIRHRQWHSQDLAVGGARQ